MAAAPVSLLHKNRRATVRPQSTLETMVKYGCVDHPTLAPDAWHQVETGKPMAAGARAALVCRFSCPARDQCPVAESLAAQQAQHSEPKTVAKTGGWAETIYSKGWFDRQGNLIPFADNEIEAHQAAAYLGMQLHAFQYLVRLRDLQSRKLRHARFYKLSDIRALAAGGSGIACGNQAKLILHELRGDGDCPRCSPAVKG